MSTNKQYKTDYWREHNYFTIIRPQNNGKGWSSRPQDNTYHGGCTPEEAWEQYPAHIYVLYDSRKGTYNNMYYIGSTTAGHTKRKQYHLDECYCKLATSKLYIWMRARCPTRPEAEAHIKCVYLHHVHFKKDVAEDEKEKVLHEIERQFINDFYHPQRSLNTNLLSDENKKKKRNAIKEESKGVKLRSLLYQAIGDVLAEDDAATIKCMLKDIQSLLLAEE